MPGMYMSRVNGDSFSRFVGLEARDRQRSGLGFQATQDGFKSLSRCSVYAAYVTIRVMGPQGFQAFDKMDQ